MMQFKCPKAHSFQLAMCDDVSCGPHIVALDRNNRAICEIIMTQEAARDFIKSMQGILYERAAMRD